MLTKGARTSVRAPFTFLEVGMATKQGILEALVGESGPITAAALAAGMNVELSTSHPRRTRSN